MSTSLTRFSPLDHGFRFPNYFQFKSGLTYSLPIFGLLDLDHVVFGLCGGMCFAALDYFHAAAPRPTVDRVETVDRPLFLYLAQRQLDSIPIPTVIKIAEWMLSEPETIARKMTRSELPRLLKQLAAGKPQVLCLIRVRGLTDPTHNHQVLATGYDLDEAAHSLKIYIYDPNHPNQRPTITVDQAHPAAPGWLQQSTLEPDPLHGFFLIPYRTQKTFPAAASIPGEDAGVSRGRVHPAKAALSGVAPEAPHIESGGLALGEGESSLAPGDTSLSAPGGVLAAGHPLPPPSAPGGGLALGEGESSLAPGGVLAAGPALPYPITLRWPTDSSQINQRFGEHPASYRPFGLPGHEGLDLYAVTGAAVYACAPGIAYQVNHPSGHPYGLQVRLRHDQDGLVYHTIYAHLSETCVEKGQTVAAGQLIGRADNTGNSFGAHLHLTLKIEGAQTPGYPPGIVDPLPYLQTEASGQAILGAALRPALPPGAIFTTRDLNLRAGPSAADAVLTILPAGEVLTPLDDPAAALAATGQPDTWLHVATASGQTGYVAAWYTAGAAAEAFPPTGLVVYPVAELNLRAGPGLGFASLAVLPVTAPLTVLGDEPTARARLGRSGRWLQVLAGGGQRGFVAAWLVRQTGQLAPSAGLAVTPLDVINIRARPALDANVLTTALPGDRLAILGDPAAALAALGREGQWLNVQPPGGPAGYAAAWYLTAIDAEPAALPLSSPTPGSNIASAIDGIAALTRGGVSAASTPDDVPAALAPGAPTPLAPGGVPAAWITVTPTARIVLRAQPAPGSPRIGYAHVGQPLTVIQPDLAAARALLGQTDCWLRVAAPSGKRGWAPAWLLKPLNG